PTRLINIRKFPHVFLEHFPDSSSFSGEYVYLSFNWGKVQPQRTMISTLEDHLEDLGFDQLPQTFKDGIELASFLAISYIWIDALCVIQDSAEDWQREAGRMGNYIRNAACVVSALAS
ncbi:HET-domain-containing protein, partial [Mollisia scopiformis]